MMPFLNIKEKARLIAGFACFVLQWFFPKFFMMPANMQGFFACFFGYITCKLHLTHKISI